MSNLERFTWAPRPGMNISEEPAVSVVKFGDGYEQRRPKGINNKLEKYSVTFRVSPENGLLIKAFFNRHGAVKPFIFQCPYTYRDVKVVCRKWSTGVNNVFGDISAEFEEVIA